MVESISSSNEKVRIKEKKNFPWALFHHTVCFFKERGERARGNVLSFHFQAFPFSRKVCEKIGPTPYISSIIIFRIYIHKHPFAAPPSGVWILIHLVLSHVEAAAGNTQPMAHTTHDL